MDTTIDTLKIEIQADTSKATNSIKDLEDKLSSLKTTVNNTINELKSLAGAIDKLPTKKDVTINTKTVEASSKGVKNKTSEVSQNTSSAVPKVDTGADEGVKKVNKLQLLMKKIGSNPVLIKVQAKLEPAEKAVNSFFSRFKKKSSDSGDTEITPKVNTTNVNKNLDEVTKKFGELKSVLKNLFGGAIIKGIKFVGNGIKSIKTNVQKLKDVASNTIKNMTGGFSNLIKKLGFVTLAAAGVRGAFTALRRAADAYMQRDEDMQKQLQNNWGVLGSLLAPIIQNIINLFTKAVSYIAAFIKALTGIDLVARANAKALNKQSAAAKKAANELGNLASFDDLHEVKFNDSSSSGSDLEPLKVGEIDDEPFNTFIEKIKKKDWYGLGMEIGRSINEGLASIDWDTVIEKSIAVGKAFGDLFNGLTDGIDWTLLGFTISNGLNTLIEGINTFFATYNFTNLGTSLSTGLLSAIDTLDWNGLGIAFTNRLAALRDTVAAFVSDFGKNMGFEKLGKDIAIAFEAGVKNIDIKKSVNTALAGLNGLTTTISTFLKSVDWASLGSDVVDGATKIISWLLENIPTLLGQVIDTIKTFFSEVDWSDVTNQLWESLDKGLENMFTTITGNETAGKVLKDLAIAIAAVAAAVKILTAAWAVYKTIKAAVTAVEVAFNIATAPATILIVAVVAAVAALIVVLGYLITHWDDVKEAFVGAITTIWNWLKKAANWFAEKVLAPIVNAFERAIDNIKLGIENFKEKLRFVFDVVKTIITHPFETMKSVVTTVVDKAKSIFDNLRDKITGVFDKIKDAIGGFKDKFKEVFEGLWNIAKTPLNWIIDGVNKMIKGINKIKFDVPDWVPVIGGGQFGFNLPEIPKLATGTNRIEAEGLYHLHKDEAVVPKKYNPAVNNQSYNEANSAMLAKVDKLINILDNMETTNVFNVDGDEVSRSVQKRVNRQNSIYGTNAIKV